MPDFVVAVVALGVMIFCHELGHFLVAKRVGITVRAFALGFGPRLVGFRRGETTYAINLLPLGGYVRMAGEDLDDAPAPGSFRARSVWQRMAVVVAGPTMNLLLAVALIAVVLMFVGVIVDVTNRIGALEPGWPAERAGLRPGDAIVAIDGVRMTSGEQVVQTIHRNPNRLLVLTVERDGRELQVRVTSRHDPQRKVGLIGFRPAVVRERMGPARAVVEATTATVRYIGMIFVAVGGLIREGTLLSQMQGPVGAVRFLGETAQFGFDLFLETAAAISVMIAIFNLLPFPALDGGRLLFLVVEAVRHRPVDPRREGYIHLVGFALLLLLLVTLTISDLGQL